MIYMRDFWAYRTIPYVCFWPEGEVSGASCNVRFSLAKGLVMLTVSSSPFDPKATLDGPASTRPKDLASSEEGSLNPDVFEVIEITGQRVFG